MAGVIAGICDLELELRLPLTADVAVTSTFVIRGAPDAKSTGSISTSLRRKRLPEIGFRGQRSEVKPVGDPSGTCG